jgi:ADP-heptose:LPS heptosyltransferase
MSQWNTCKNLLCVRLDNMGDVLMSAPAMASLKESFQCKITLLTSSMAAPMAGQIPVIDEVLIFDVPWVKSNVAPDPAAVETIVNMLRQKSFDGGIVFSVFSQNPMAAILILWLAGIPKRAAFCRENPYLLLTDWLPDLEPYQLIRHQVRRDLALVEALGATPCEGTIPIRVRTERLPDLNKRLAVAGVKEHLPWVILHAGVSEAKREFPEDRWVEIGKRIVNDLHHQVVITGGKKDIPLAQRIAGRIGPKATAIAGELDLTEFILLVHQASLIITVNTATAHIAAATQSKVIVLYALTNPQHAPWRTIGKVLPYSIASSSESKNEILQFIHRTHFVGHIPIPTAGEVVQHAFELLNDINTCEVPELVGIKEPVSAEHC